MVQDDDVPSDTFDAGAMGCGELLIKMKLRIAALKPGEVFLLIALDPGAIEDIPSWCRMTRHALVRAEHPRYWIRRREE